MASPDESTYSGRLFGLTAFAVVVVGLYVGKPLLLPLALATLVCFVLTPLAQRLERVGVGRIASVLTVVGATFLIVGALGYVVTRQVISLSEQLPEYRETLVSRVRDLRSQTGGSLSGASKTLEEIGEELSTEEDTPDEKDASQETGPQRSADRRAVTKKKPDVEAVAVKVVELPFSPLEQIRSWLGPLVAPLVTAALVIVLVIFMLIQREDLRNRFIELMGTGQLHTTTLALTEAADRVSRYLLMTLLINASYGVAVTVGLFLIGLPNAFLWGVLGTLLRYLPYVGPWTAAALPITLSLAVFDGWSQPLMTIGLFIVLELVVNNILEPLLYSNSIGASTVGVIVSAGAWTLLWGPVGLFLAMPLTVCLVVAGQFFPPLRVFSILLGDRSNLSPAERIYQRLLAQDEDEAKKLATEYQKGATLEQFCDEVMLPVLMMTERDSEAGLLSEAQQAVLLSAAEQSVDEAQARVLASGNDATRPAPPTPLRLLCAPVSDQADEVVADTLHRLLSMHGHHVETGSRNLLASELVQRVAEEQYDAVILSALPPLSNRNGRYLCRQLRQRFGRLPIIYGLWNGAELTHVVEGLAGCGATRVVTQLRQAIVEVNRVALELRYAKTASGDVQDAGSEIGGDAYHVQRSS